MKYLPFDISIYDDPLVRRLSPFQIGLFTFLVLDYWRTGIPLPEYTKSLVELSNTNFQKWEINKVKVMLGIKSVMPGVTKDRKEKQEKREYRLGTAKRALTAQLRKRAAKNVIFSDDLSTHRGFTPLPVRQEFNDGKSDKTARLAALDVKLPPGDNTFAD